jgi:hypothetical protein
MERAVRCDCGAWTRPLPMRSRYAAPCYADRARSQPFASSRQRTCSCRNYYTVSLIGPGLSWTCDEPATFAQGPARPALRRRAASGWRGCQTRTDLDRPESGSEALAVGLRAVGLPEHEVIARADLSRRRRCRRRRAAHEPAPAAASGAMWLQHLGMLAGLDQAALGLGHAVLHDHDPRRAVDRRTSPGRPSTCVLGEDVDYGGGDGCSDSTPARTPLDTVQACHGPEMAATPLVPASGRALRAHGSE